MVDNQTKQPVPSRWKGNRVIDWLMADNCLSIDRVHYGDECFGDHKMLKFVCFADFREANNHELIPTPVLWELSMCEQNVFFKRNSRWPGARRLLP